MATYRSLLSDNSTSDPVPKPRPRLFYTELTLLHHAHVLFSASSFLSTDSRSVQNLKSLSRDDDTPDNKSKGSRVHLCCKRIKEARVPGSTVSPHRAAKRPLQASGSRREVGHTQGPAGREGARGQRVGKGRAVGVPPTPACRRPPRSARVQCWFPAQPPRGRTRRCHRSRRTRRSQAGPPRVPLWRPPYYQVPALQLSPPASQPWRPRADVQTSWRAD